MIPKFGWNSAEYSSWKTQLYNKLLIIKDSLFILCLFFLFLHFLNCRWSNEFAVVYNHEVPKWENVWESPKDLGTDIVKSQNQYLHSLFLGLLLYETNKTLFLKTMLGLLLFVTEFTPTWYSYKTRWKVKDNNYAERKHSKSTESTIISFIKWYKQMSYNISSICVWEYL